MSEISFDQYLSLYPMRTLLMMLIVLTTWQTNCAFAQQCGTSVIMEQMQQRNPRAWANIIDIQQRPLHGLKLADEVYTIPVVVHVVYNTDAQNIDDTRIYTQINVLNADFRRLNADTTETPGPFQEVAADVQLEFCLASLDPDGNPTTGIVRTYTDTTIWDLSYSENVKYSDLAGDDAWPASAYLNIWVCNLADGILGYAVSPGAPPDVDGIVVDYKNFGLADISSAPYHMGRTTTHEVGHWLGLTHIWGDDGGACAGDDGMEDTPIQAGPTYGCPDFPLLDDCNTAYPGIMYDNYMDYTDDLCMNIFTQDQKERMRNVMFTYRASLLTSTAGCNEIGPLPGDIAELSIYPVPNNGQCTVSVKNFAGTLGTMELSVYNSLGQHLGTISLEAANNVAQYIDLSAQAPGTYFVQVFNGTYFLTKPFLLF